MIDTLQNLVVFIPFSTLLLCCIILTFRTRFIQIRAIPRMVKLLYKSFTSKTEGTHTIKAHKALFTAMATTIGIGNIAGPIIAIGIGGPGTLIGYMLATFFGSAATFVEVTFAQKYKDAAPAGKKIGGPMHYLKRVFHPSIAYIYATAGFLLILAWSAAQANTIGVILTSYHIPPVYTGIVLSVVTLSILIGGIKRIGAIAELMVPFMFILYSGAVSWILFCNASAIPGAFKSIFTALFTPSELAGGVSLAGIVHTLRWGLARGFNSNESGIGTATIPHSKAEAASAIDQGILSVVSVFSNGILCLLTGLCFLVTDMNADFGTESVAVITRLFSTYLPGFGPPILIVSMALFVVSTVIGNSYNGSELFSYSLGRNRIRIYYALCAASIFLGTLFSVQSISSFVDILSLPVFLPHIIGLLILSFTHKRDLEFSSK